MNSNDGLSQTNEILGIEGVIKVRMNHKTIAVQAGSETLFRDLLSS